MISLSEVATQARQHLERVSGFHALRGLELVMASYYEAVNGSTGEFRSWADYIKAFGNQFDTGMRSDISQAPGY